MFGPSDYVPVLKLKRAEKKALTRVAPRLRQHVVPLLEIVERTSAPSIDRHLSTSFRDLASSLTGYPRCLLDAREIESDGTSAAHDAFNRALTSGISFTPVTGISRTVDLSPAIAFGSINGIGLRLTRPEFENGNLAVRVNRFMSVNGLTPDLVDLIVDLGPVDDLIIAGIVALTRAFLGAIPDKRQWRTLTVSASAFPLSMGVVNRHSSARIERSEWLAWRNGLFAQRATLERLPTFSDCAIQHPVGVENFDFRTMQVSATIRYTSDDDWLLIKGESTRVSRPSIQFPILATKLVYGQLQSAFEETHHCYACQMVKDSADGSSGLGSAEVWRQIGTIHHITTVVQDDLASLQFP